MIRGIETISTLFAVALLVGAAAYADAQNAPPRPRDYRDEVISALQLQRNQSQDAVASLNATLVQKQGEADSLTEQLKNSDERVKKLEEELKAKVSCAPDPKDH